jgi:tetratricopeptide (TPR) repeat protein
MHSLKWVGFFVLALCLPASADEIQLKDGEKIEGLIITMTDSEIVVRWGAGKSTLTRVIKRADVKEIRIKPPEMSRLREIARRAEADHDLADAAVVWQQVCTFRPESADDQMRRARALRDSGQGEEAISAFQAALQLRPDDLKPWIELSELQLKCKLVRESAQSAMQYLKRATTGLDEATWMLGRSFEAANQPEDAMDAFRQTLQHNPRHGGAMERLVHLHLERQDFAEAENAARAFLKIAPESRSGSVALGMILYRQKKFVAAVDAFKAATALGGPGYDRARVFLNVARARVEGKDPLKDLGDSLLPTVQELDPELRRDP